MRSTPLLLAFLMSLMSYSQDLDLLDEPKEETVYTFASFKTNRIVNGHSVEMVMKRNFDFKISHRFGLMDEGFYDLFGLDEASIRIGGDYGITNNLNVGVGRSTFEKTYDGYIKYRLKNDVQPPLKSTASGCLL